MHTNTLTQAHADTRSYTHTATPIGIRDRAETKELMFTRKLFSLNVDLRRLSAVYFFFLLSIAPFAAVVWLPLQHNKTTYVRSRVLEYSLFSTSLFVSWAHSSYSLHRHLFVVDIYFLYWHISLSLSVCLFFAVAVERV